MALIVIDVVTSPRGRSASSRRMSASESMATPDPADLAVGAGVIGVVAHLGRKVESARQSGLAGAEQELEAFVGGLSAAEAGVLAHRPEPAPVHRGMDAAGVREAPGSPQLGVGIPTVEIIAL